jgi:threonine dehydrogenase-like Zn-dependent dehydrogenase
MGIFPGSGRVDLSPVIKKELTIRGSFGSIHSSWERVLGLVGRGLVDLGSLITETLPLEQWKRGFELMEKRQACKVVLLPEQE